MDSTAAPFRPEWAVTLIFFPIFARALLNPLVTVDDDITPVLFLPAGKRNVWWDLIAVSHLVQRYSVALIYPILATFFVIFLHVAAIVLGLTEMVLCED